MGDHDVSMENALAIPQQNVSTLALPESIVQTDLARMQTVQAFALQPQHDGTHQQSQSNVVALLRGRVLTLESEARTWHEGFEREVAYAAQQNRQQLEEAQNIGQLAFNREAYIAKEAEMQASNNARAAICAEQETGQLRGMLEVANSQSQQVSREASRNWQRCDDL